MRGRIPMRAFMNEASSRPTYVANEKVYDRTEHFNVHPFFDNLIWLTTDEAASFLRKSSLIHSWPGSSLTLNEVA